MAEGSSGFFRAHVALAKAVRELCRDPEVSGADILAAVHLVAYELCQTTSMLHGLSDPVGAVAPMRDRGKVQ
jgi:hypothetical protein